MKKIIFTLLALSIFSCSDFLQREPVEQISINNQLKTKKGILEALNGTYYSLRSTLFTESFLVYADAMSGNLGFTPTPSGEINVPNRIANVYNFNDISSQSDMASFYGDAYKIINNLNLILSKVEEVPDATSSEKSQIKAEALAMRAYLHFLLVKIYAQNYTYTPDASHLGIVYNIRPLKVGEDYPSRLTVKETFHLLEKDITEAIALFQAERAISVGNERNYIHKNVAKAIAADIFLWKNDWQKAYEYSQDLIQTSGKELSDYSNLSQWASSELLFELPNTINNASAVSNIYSVGANRPKYTISNALYTALDSSDKRKMLLELKKYKTTGHTDPQPYYFTTKYKNQVSNVIYRLTEMYFIRAEASLHLNNSQQALSDINTIRTRAGLSTLTTINMEDLLEEKRKEFAFENKYFFDLVRNHKDITRPNCLASTCDLAYPNNKFVLPIPQASINLNINMKQNEGY